MQMVCNLREFKEFIDNEMIVILGQMDSPTEIFEHVYLVRTQKLCSLLTMKLLSNPSARQLRKSHVHVENKSQYRI